MSLLRGASQDVLVKVVRSCLKHLRGVKTLIQGQTLTVIRALVVIKKVVKSQRIQQILTKQQIQRTPILRK